MRCGKVTLSCYLVLSLVSPAAWALAQSNIAKQYWNLKPRNGPKPFLPNASPAVTMARPEKVPVTVGEGTAYVNVPGASLLMSYERSDEVTRAIYTKLHAAIHRARNSFATSRNL